MAGVRCPVCETMVQAAPASTGLLTCPSCNVGFAAPGGTMLSVVARGEGAAAQLTNLELPAAFRERFRIERIVGAGGQGTVHLATMLSTGRTVAVKVLLAREGESLARFTREGQLMRALDHPHLAAVVEAGSIDGHPYLAMEFLGGGSLRTRLTEGGPMTPKLSATIMADIVSALAACHARGIVHRDLKPENVLFSESGAAKLTDLGIARVLGGEGTNLTMGGAILGTGCYLSPEVIAGVEAGPGSDIFAAGVTLYEMIAGVRPFEGDNLYLVMKAIETATPRSLAERVPGTPPAVSSLVMECLSRDPNQRPAASSLANRLRQAVGLPRHPQADAVAWSATPAARPGASPSGPRAKPPRSSSKPVAKPAGPSTNSILHMMLGAGLLALAALGLFVGKRIRAIAALRPASPASIAASAAASGGSPPREQLALLPASIEPPPSPAPAVAPQPLSPRPLASTSTRASAAPPFAIDHPLRTATSIAPSAPPEPQASASPPPAPPSASPPSEPPPTGPAVPPPVTEVPVETRTPPRPPPTWQPSSPPPPTPSPAKRRPSGPPPAPGGPPQPRPQRPQVPPPPPLTEADKHTLTAQIQAYQGTVANECARFAKLRRVADERAVGLDSHDANEDPEQEKASREEAMKDAKDLHAQVQYSECLERVAVGLEDLTQCRVESALRNVSLGAECFDKSANANPTSRPGTFLLRRLQRMALRELQRNLQARMDSGGSCTLTLADQMLFQRVQNGNPEGTVAALEVMVSEGRDAEVVATAKELLAALRADPSVDAGLVQRVERIMSDASYRLEQAGTK